MSHSAHSSTFQSQVFPKQSVALLLTITFTLTKEKYTEKRKINKIYKTVTLKQANWSYLTI